MFPDTIFFAHTGATRVRLHVLGISVLWLALACAVPATTSWAATYRWINPAGGNWSTPANWDLGQIPAPGADVVFPDLGAPYLATMDVQTVFLSTLVIETDARLRQGTDLSIPGLFCSGVMSIAGDLVDAGNVVAGSSIVILPTGTVTLRVGEELWVSTTSLVNDGVITLGSTDDTNLLVKNDLTIGGSGRIELSGLSGIVRPNGSTAQVVNGSGHTIHAVGGRVLTPLANHGSVIVEDALFTFSGVANDGVIQALPGSDVRGSITNSGGEFLIDGGRFSGGFDNSDGVIEIVSGTFGGDLTDNAGGLIHLTGASCVLSGALSNGGGEIVSDGDVVLQGYNLAGGVLRGPGNFIATSGSLSGIDLDASTDVEIVGTTGLFGPVLLHDGMVRVTNGSVLAIMSDVVIHGAGAFLLEGGTLGGPGRLTNSTGHTISGFGTILAPIVNHGLVLATGALRVEGTVINNGGVLRSAQGAALRFVGSVDNGNGVIAASGGEVRIDGGAQIDGGSIVADGADVVLGPPACSIGGSELSGTGSSRFRNNGMATLLTDVTLASGTELFNIGTLLVDGSRLLNHGLLRTTGTVESAFGASLLGDGVIALEGGTLSGDDAVHQGAGHTIRGIGTIQPRFVNRGILQPGASPGAVHVAGNYQQFDTGRLEIELAGTGEGAFDRLDVSGSAILDGVFAVSVIDGYAPAEGDAFQVMTFASRTGDFSAYEGLSLGGGGMVQPFFTGVNDALYLRVDDGVVPVAGRPLPQALRFYAPHGGRVAELALELPEDAEVALGVYDVAGRQAWRTSTTLPAGTHRVRVGESELPAGVYFARGVVRSASAVAQRTTRLWIAR